MSFESSLRRLAIVTAVAAITAAASMVSTAEAQPPRPNGYPITNVNLRAGPGTYYPALLVVPSRAPITIFGCLGDYTWCDVIFQGNRGWMRSIYLQGWYRGYYYSLRDYAPRLGYRVVSFDLGGYWDANYRGRPFYRDRDRWGGGSPYGEGATNRGAFYNRLAPYGDWIWLQGQYVWVPENVGPRWRPYTVGRWVFTDRYGWMWVSDEPFGWATYHYGRWGFSNRVGWFWVPGSRWAPAWVAWRSSNDYLAWAPLPPTPDEGLSININVGNVPDYYWQVVPNQDFLAPDLPRRIVRDRDRYRPILRDTQPIGNVMVVNNTVVNNVVNVTYVEEKTKKKVVVHRVEKTKDEEKAKGGKIKGETVEIFQPAPEAKPEAVVPAASKPIEEVAAESKTKEQGEGAAATDELLVPPEIKKPLAAEAKPPAPPPPATEGAAPAAEEAAPPPPPPPPAETVSPPPPVEEVAPLPPPAPPGQEAAPEVKKQSKPKKDKEAEPVDGGPPPLAPPPADEVAPPPPPPVEEVAPPPPPLPPAEETAPRVKKQGKPKKDKEAEPVDGGPPPLLPPPADEAAPPPPPPVEEVAPPPPPLPPAEETAPRVKKQGKPKKDKEAEPVDGGPPPLPPPPADEAAPPPPPPVEEVAPRPPSQLPAEEMAPKVKKQGKARKDRETEPEDSGAPIFPPPPPAEEAPLPPPPPAEDIAPPSSPPISGDDAQNKKDGKPKRKKDRDAPCPDGMVDLEDGTCVPAQ